MMSRKPRGLRATKTPKWMSDPVHSGKREYHVLIREPDEIARNAEFNTHVLKSRFGGEPYTFTEKEAEEVRKWAASERPDCDFRIVKVNG